MCKVKFPLFVLGLLLCLSGVSEAKVCFLGGGQCNVGAEYVKSTKCPNQEQCEIPSKKAQKCEEGGSDLYKPEECCSNDEYWETCDATQRCEGSSCTGKNSANIEVTRCEKDQCKCKSEYNKDCEDLGMIGYGPSCNGLYAECRCDTTKYFKCDSTATSVGVKCTDSTGTYYPACTCPALSVDVWEDTGSDCCRGYSDTCTERPGGTKYYKCKSWTAPNCTCGYTYISGKPACVDGCTDGNFDYKGSSTNVTCDESQFDIANTGICGNNCRCSAGYWDYTVTCGVTSETVCADLGYTETSCEDDYLACPFDASALVCIEGEEIEEDDEPEKVCPEGEYATQELCETEVPYALCSENTETTCWEPTSCNTSAGYISGGGPGIYKYETLHVFGTMPCLELVGCKTDNIDETVFVLAEDKLSYPSFSDIECPYVVGCQDGYVNVTTCPSGTTELEKHASYGKTSNLFICLKCGCEYSTADACQTDYPYAICTSNSSGCFEPTACNTSAGYDDEYSPSFNYSTAGTIGNTTCYKINGCAESNIEIVNSNLVSLINKTLGKTTCQIYNGCNNDRNAYTACPSGTCNCSTGGIVVARASGNDIKCFVCREDCCSSGDSSGGSTSTSFTCDYQSYSAITKYDSSNPASGTNYDICGWKVAKASTSNGGTTWSLTEQWIQYCCTSSACKYSSTSNPPGISTISHYVDSHCGVITSGNEYYVYLK